MPPSINYLIQGLYLQQSQYSDRSEEKVSEPPLIHWPQPGYFQNFKPDSHLLEKSLQSDDTYSSNPSADQVFGSNLRQQKTELKHLAHLLYERSLLHRDHLKDIDDRHLKTQERLFGAEINHTPDRLKNIQRLEGQLMQLEHQRREEELAFWKDTVDLRKGILETSGDYRDNRRRYQIFSDISLEENGRA